MDFDTSVTSNESSTSQNGPEWPTCDPDLVLSVLRNLEPEHCAQGKTFFKTVFRWGDINSQKRNKCKAFWDAQSIPVRTGMIIEVNELERNVRETENRRSVNTTRQDRCRLMHLFVDSEMQTLWTKALSPLEREELDSVDLRKSAYEDLAHAFNDRKERKYQNACIAYVDGKAVNPYESVAGMECIAQTCHDLDPNDPSRPDRDATWIEKVSKDIRGTMSKAYQNYRRSGNQDAENKFLEWCKYVTNVSDVYKYCFILMPDTALDQLGRALPEEMQRDTAGRPPREYSVTPSATNRRRQRARKSEMESSDVRSNTPSPGIAAVLDIAVKMQQKQQALFHFALHGNDEEKGKATARLASLAFGEDDN